MKKENEENEAAELGYADTVGELENDDEEDETVVVVEDLIL